MMNERENIRLSKFLSYVLRHKPWEIGIVLDENGWTDVDTLLNQLAGEGENITMDVLTYVVDNNPKKRFSFNDGKSKIRANQGHSVTVQLDYPEQQPPAFLYHGTVERFVPLIMSDGLQKMSRHHVHLGADTSTAKIVGQRRGKPVILQVNAGEMFAQNYIFYLSGNNVWLTDHVPPEFIEQLPY